MLVLNSLLIKPIENNNKTHKPQWQFFQFFSSLTFAQMYLSSTNREYYESSPLKCTYLNEMHTQSYSKHWKCKLPIPKAKYVLAST